MDKILIDRLELYARIGVKSAEREVGQWLVASLEVDCDLSRAGQSDNLHDTLSYSDIARTIHEIGVTTTCDLLEYMAEKMCAALLERFPAATTVRLRLLKRPPPVALSIAEAGIEMTRSR